MFSRVSRESLGGEMSNSIRKQDENSVEQKEERTYMKSSVKNTRGKS